jgi:putative inorganic carbon (hco3(-)) transporter
MNEPQPETAPAQTADGAEAEAALDPNTWAGAPLKATLKLMVVPGVLGVFILLGGGLPTWLLYGVAGVFGLAVLPRLLRDPEPVMAIAIAYLPLNKMFAVPIAPGVNATNVVEALLLYHWFRAGRGDPDAPRNPASRLVAIYAGVSLFSVVTALVVAGADFVSDKILDVRWWLDQFIVYFTFARLIKDGKMAQRLLVYMMLTSTVILGLGVQEWIDKRDASSIEKARLLGPQLQPNDFGAFMAYAAAPFIALVLINIARPRVLAYAIPYLLMTARILLATFSRGAYLGVALGAVVAGYVRGKFFLIGAAVFGLLLVVVFPQIVPESLRARMGQTASEGGATTESVDKSSQTRLILWEAALKITKKSPLFGFGFKTFPKYKGEFTEEEVHESDNHNMYLYLTSQMGIPAALLLLLIMWRMGVLGARVYRASDQNFERVVGMTATALAGSAFLVNMFGSRMVDICVSVNFWITLAIVSRLWMEIEARKMAEQPR